MAKPVVGLIGLGLMGAGFARRLIATGHQVIGFDVVNEKVDAAVKLGASPASSPADVARQSDIVLTSLTATKNLKEVIEGIAGAGRLDGKVLVDHSTADIDTTKRLAALLTETTGMAFIDAPVSGGPGAAETGTLAIMAGGSADAIARALPVLSQLGRVTHMGGIGAGQATKLVNQALVLTNYCVIAEAPRIAIEAAVQQSWNEWLRPGDAFVGLSDFGASAPGPKVYEHFGLTAERVAAEARKIVKR